MEKFIYQCAVFYRRYEDGHTDIQQVMLFRSEEPIEDTTKLPDVPVGFIGKIVLLGPFDNTDALIDEMNKQPGVKVYIDKCRRDAHDEHIWGR